MATTKVTPIQLLRSEVLNKRPDPSKLLSGQVAVNLAPTQPGMFFSDSGGSLVKIGPCTVGTNPPNAATGWPNPPSPSATGNTLGELWLDTTNSLVPALKVYDGTSWRYASPPTLIQDTVPVLSDYPDNSIWWDSSTGLMYILYYDGATRQWTQVSSTSVQ